MGKTTFVLGAAVGYVLGARAGRSSYDQIVAQASKIWGNPKVQDTVSQAKETAINSSAAQAVKEKLPTGGSGSGGTSSTSSGTGTSSGTSSTSGTGTSSGTGGSSGPVTSPVVDPLLNTPSTTGQPGTTTPSTPATPGTAFPRGV